MSEVQLLDFGETEQEVFTRWDITGHQVNRHLLSKALTGTDDVVLDHLTFPPGFLHHMHRHPHADMVIIPVSGVVQFLGAPGSPVEVSPGHLLVIPRGNWHEISNVGTVDSQVLHFFAGVGSVDDIGYEAYRGRARRSDRLVGKGAAHADSNHRTRQDGTRARRAVARRRSRGERVEPDR